MESKAPNKQADHGDPGIREFSPRPETTGPPSRREQVRDKNGGDVLLNGLGGKRGRAMGRRIWVYVIAFLGFVLGSAGGRPGAGSSTT